MTENNIVYRSLLRLSVLLVRQSNGARELGNVAQALEIEQELKKTIHAMADGEVNLFPNG